MINFRVYRDSWKGLRQMGHTVTSTSGEWRVWRGRATDASPRNSGSAACGRSKGGQGQPPSPHSRGSNPRFSVKERKHWFSSRVCEFNICGNTCMFCPLPFTFHGELSFSFSNIGHQLITLYCLFHYFIVTNGTCNNENPLYLHGRYYVST